MLQRSHFSILSVFILVSLLISAIVPSPVLADDLPPISDTETEVEIDSETDDTVVEPENQGIDVVITDEAGEIVSADTAAGEDALLNGEPVWCPDGQTPDENSGNCTAPYGSIGDLLTDIADDGPDEEGMIYIQTSSAETIEVSEMPSADLVVEIVQTDTQTDLGILVDGEAQAVGEAGPATSGPVDVSCLPASGMDAGTCLGEEYQAVAGAVIVDEETSVNDNSGSEGQTDAPVLEAGDAGVVAVTEENVGLVVESELDAGSAVVPAVEDSPTLADAVTTDPEAVERDPVWCPDGTTPTPGSSQCTSSFDTLGELVTYLMNNQPTQNGTIWIEEGNDASTDPISINGAIATTWANYALTLNGGWSGTPGDASIVGKTTFSKFIEITSWQNDVSINDITIQNTNGIGLFVEADGDIAVDNVSSDGNFDMGAVLVNCGVGGFPCEGIETNTVTLTGTNSFNDNGSAGWGANGLIIVSDSDVYLNNITANNNEMDWGDFGGTGLYVRTTSGDIILTGTNTFNGNTEAGAQFYTGGPGNVYLENLNVNTSMSNGVAVNLEMGDAYVGGVNTFENTHGDAIIITSSGDIFASNLNTNNTGGIHLETHDGSVFLMGSNYFNNTIYQGHVMFIQASEDVFVEGVTSVNGTNGDGMKIGAGGDVVVNCSYSGNNSEYGLEVGFDDWMTDQPLYYPDTLTLNNVTFSNNAYGDTFVNGNSTDVTVNQNYPCPQTSSGGNSLSDVVNLPSTPYRIPLLLNLISLGDTGLSTPLALDCTQYSEYVLALANGDSVTYSCPITGNANVARLGTDPAQLPGALPPGNTFVSGLTSFLTETTGGVINISFTIPADLLNSSLTILYWDGTAWVDLATATFPDGKLVYDKGTKTADGKYQVSTNFAGTFVLVKK